MCYIPHLSQPLYSVTLLIYVKSKHLTIVYDEIHNFGFRKVLAELKGKLP